MIIEYTIERDEGDYVAVAHVALRYDEIDWQEVRCPDGSVIDPDEFSRNIESLKRFESRVLEKAEHRDLQDRIDAAADAYQECRF